MIDIDEGTRNGFTALMVAASFGHPRVARILLNKGANASLTSDEGFAAVHLTVQNSRGSPGRDKAAGEGRRRPGSKDLYALSLIHI